MKIEITNETDYLAALDRVERLMNNTEEGTPGHEELISLSDAVKLMRTSTIRWGRKPGRKRVN